MSDIAAVSPILINQDRLGNQTYDYVGVQAADQAADQAEAMLEVGYEPHEIGQPAAMLALANEFFYSWVAQAPTIYLLCPDRGGFHAGDLHSIRNTLSAVGMDDCAAIARTLEQSGATDPNQMPDMFDPEQRQRGMEIMEDFDKAFEARFSWDTFASRINSWAKDNPAFRFLPRDDYQAAFEALIRRQ